VGKYQRETKIVLIGEGKSFRYELDASKARMPALAAVSPNRATGPTLSISCLSKNGKEKYIK
jgi:hypothetical protein